MYTSLLPLFQAIYAYGYLPTFGNAGSAAIRDEGMPGSSVTDVLVRGWRYHGPFGVELVPIPPLPENLTRF